MDKKELRAVIRAQKRAMTNAQIDACSEKLAALFRAHPLYQQAKASTGICHTIRRCAPCRCSGRHS